MLDFETSFVNTNGVAFPDTEAVNVSAPGAGDGTEFVAILVNHIWGQAQALLDFAGMTPDGVQEAPDTAQILEALFHTVGGPGEGVIYWKNDTPAVWGDRVLLLQGQEISQATYARLFAAVYCGDAANAAAPAFYSTNGAGVRTTPGAGGTHFVLPDARGLSLKNIGNATVNGRTKTGPVSLGEEQEDQMQGHFHNMKSGGRDLYCQDSLAGGYGLSLGGPGAIAIIATTDGEITDGVNGTSRAGTNTRDSSLGTNYGIRY